MVKAMADGSPRPAPGADVGRAGSCAVPVAYRRGSQAARVCEWVLARPEWSMFQLSDVPASPQVAAKTLSQMARRDPRVERITKGWYLRVGDRGPGSGHG